jgi:hypothetical protein
MATDITVPECPNSPQLSTLLRHSPALIGFSYRPISNHD